MQQRAIRADAIERLLEFGRVAFDHRGGVVLYFDKAARRRPPVPRMGRPAMVSRENSWRADRKMGVG